MTKTRFKPKAEFAEFKPMRMEREGLKTGMARLDELGVKITPYCWVKEITDKGAACIFGPSGREFDVEADTIILVTTKYSNTELYDVFKQRGVECHLIGDARTPRWIWNATHDGYKMAREI